MELVGRAQAHRIYAHYGVPGQWVGQCTYAFCVRIKPGLPISRDDDDDEALGAILRDVEREHQAEARRAARRRMREAARVNGGVRRRILADIDAV